MSQHIARSPLRPASRPLRPDRYGLGTFHAASNGCRSRNVAIGTFSPALRGAFWARIMGFTSLGRANPDDPTINSHGLNRSRYVPHRLDPRERLPSPGPLESLEAIDPDAPPPPNSGPVPAPRLRRTSAVRRVVSVFRATAVWFLHTSADHASSPSRSPFSHGSAELSYGGELNEVVKRHDALRPFFRGEGGPSSFRPFARSHF